MHALYALDGVSSLDAGDVLTALNDPDPRVREQAVRLSERFAAASPIIRARLDELTDDPDLRVRYQLAYSLGAVPGAARDRAIARLLLRESSDGWIRLAALRSLSDGAGEVVRILISDASFRVSTDGRRLLGALATQIGAELSAIRNRGDAAILLNILDPNREVKPQFLSYVLVDVDGRIFTGMIISESSNSVTIQRPDETNATILRVDIDELKSTGLSFMPEGLETELDVEGMADVLAYLNSIP